MLSRHLTIAACVLLFGSLALSAFAGTDVQLLDAKGNPLKPGQLDKVSVTQSCGGCHDVAASAKAVHFNRRQPTADPESSSCLTCHLPTKDAFSANGTVKKMSARVDDATCLGCHSDQGIQPGHPGGSHEGKACIDCHKNVGHKTTGAASCRGCHLGSKSALMAHSGLPSLHLKRIACETCHILATPTGKAPGYVVKDHKIVPVDENGMVLHHGVDLSRGCRGRTGCVDCHSRKSGFFFGTTVTQNPDGSTTKVPNWKSMRLNRSELEISFVREGFIKRYGGWLFVLVLGATVLHYLIFGPHRVHESEDDPEVQRFTLYERMTHWLAMVLFAFLSVTGILFLLHKEAPLSTLRVIHGQVGVAFVLVLVALVTTWWRHAVFTKCDKEWICKLGGYLWIKTDCPAGKFNAGQKGFFWMVAVLGGLVISGTGIGLIVGQGNAPSWAYTLHDVAAIALICGIGAHVYLGIFANPGTVMSIISGRVKRSWAEKHHSEWAQKMRGE